MLNALLRVSSLVEGLCAAYSRLLEETAGAVEARLVASRVEAEREGSLALRHASMERLVAVLLSRGFRVAEWSFLEEGVSREYARLYSLLDGELVNVEIHSRWVTLPPAARVEWRRLEEPGYQQATL